MTPPVPMCLVFRLGGIGFAMPIEIVEEVHTPASDGQQQDAGGLLYRGVAIPRCDLASRFGVAPAAPSLAAAVLVLKGEEMPLAITVEKIEGVFPGSGFELHPVPVLLALQAPLPYRHLLLWQGQPLVYCEPSCLAALVERP